MTQVFDIDLYDGNMIIENNGQKILVDTGSPITFGRDNHFDFMGEQYSCSPSMLGADINSISELMNYDIDVLMGLDVIGKYKMLTDYSSKIVLFSTDEIPLESGFSTLDLTNMAGYISTVLNVNGQEITSIIDTGARISYIDEATTANESSVDTLTDYHPLCGQFQTPIYQMQASIGGNAFPAKFGNLPALFALALQMVGIKCVIGYDLFNAFKVLIDIPNNKLAVKAV